MLINDLKQEFNKLDEVIRYFIEIGLFNLEMNVSGYFEFRID